MYPSVFKPVLILAAAAILLVAMRLGASIVTMILLACFIAALLSPIYGWLKRRVPAGLALLVILLSVVINSLTENIVAPLVMGKGLSVSPTVVFLSFIFWMFILGGSGAFIAMPLTVGAILFMGSFEETRGLAALMGDIPEPAANQP